MLNYKEIITQTDKMLNSYKMKLQKFLDNCTPEEYRKYLKIKKEIDDLKWIYTYSANGR